MATLFSGIEINQQDPSQVFQFESKVGEGSYGAVYKAINVLTGKEVAVKVLDLQGDTSQVADLQREINILKTCVCPQIVEYDGAYVKDGQLWISMEYCGAGSLSDLMAICDTILDEDEIAAVMYECLLGLKYLHSNKKIHRDIKSGNILLTDDGRCKLADFGVSAELTTTVAKAATMIGTPYFMAPEVLMNSQYDSKADIWSVGITAYELALGQPPLADVHPMRAIFQIPNSPPPRLPEEQGFAPQFVQFIECCLQKDPAHRMTAAELLNLPFFAGVKTTHQIIVQELLARCKDTIDAWREADAEEQAATGDGNPYQPEVPSSGTTQVQGTTVINPADVNDFLANNATIRKTDVSSAQELQSRFDNNNNYSDGTVLIKRPTPPPAQDYGTVLIKKDSHQHFGSLKMGNKGTMSSGTMIARPNNAAVGDFQYPNYANVVAQNAKSTRSDIERVKSQLQQARAADLRAVNAFYDSKLRELDNIASQRK